MDFIYVKHPLIPFNQSYTEEEMIWCLKKAKE